MYPSAETAPRRTPGKDVKGPQLVIQESEDEQTAGSKAHRGPVLVGSIVLLLLAVGAAIFLYFWIRLSGSISTDDAAIAGIRVSISSKMMGRIRSMTVEEGDTVEAGQVLVELDDTELRDQEMQSVVSMNYNKLKLSLAGINLQKAKKEYERQKDLYESGNTAWQQYDHAADALATTKAEYALAQAQIQTAEAQLQAVRTLIDNTRIVAPVSGVIAKRSFMPGEVVQPGESILVIADLSDIWISANFEETKIRLIRPNQPVDIAIDAYPELKFTGRVDQVSSAIVPPPFSIGESTKTTQKIQVKIYLEKVPPGTRLLPGMSVVVKVKVK
jgi:membrane fusion protein (multidrug efflux system)